MTNEIVLYQSELESIRLEVRVEDDTVWLSQIQMSELFLTTKQNISLHINNIFKEKELSFESTVKEYLTVQNEGKRSVKRKVLYYNLDVIISVGYRVKSIRGTQFRIWANKVIKDYLLKGHAINYRIENLENKYLQLKNRLDDFDLQLNTNIIPKEGIYYDGQVFDAWLFIKKLVNSAKDSIILIDNYIDSDVLELFINTNNNVNIEIYTSNISRKLKLDLDRLNQQYREINIYKYNKSHDRFLILDNKTIYHIGASLKDLGKKWFAFSKINLGDNEPENMINKLKK